MGPAVSPTTQAPAGRAEKVKFKDEVISGRMRVKVGLLAISRVREGDVQVFITERFVDLR